MSGTPSKKPCRASRVSVGEAPGIGVGEQIEGVLDGPASNNPSTSLLTV